MKRLEISVLMALIFCAVVSLLSINGEYQAVRESVLRLHVIANSDCLSDQELKLSVRDALQSHVDEIFSGCTDLEDAIAAAEASTGQLRAIAEETLRRQGCDLPVTVTLERSYFNTRTYGGITLPAGMYNALRVEIGAAQGRNWWCVMFPAMCVTGADPQAELETVLTDTQLELLRADGYEVRFWCVEWLSKLFCDQ